jgi:uncharacterized protein
MLKSVVNRNCDYEVCRDCELGCCQDAKPPLTRERMTTIREYLHKNGNSEDRTFAFSRYFYPSVDSDKFCIFYDKTTRVCQIHDVKPETCRAGPITFGINRVTKKIEWFLKTSEHCRFAGKLYKNTERFKEHFGVAKDEIMRLIFELDSEALKAILAIDEPETFKISENALPEAVLQKLHLG